MDVLYDHRARDVRHETARMTAANLAAGLQHEEDVPGLARCEEALAPFSTNCCCQRQKIDGSMPREGTLFALCMAPARGSFALR
jgi:hypothetical protein